MKQYFQALPINKLFLSLTLGLCTATSQAGPVSYYREEVMFNGTRETVVTTPHNNPTTYFDYYPRNSSVTFASTPVPSITAYSSAWNTGGARNRADGLLSYTIGISEGPASTRVPVIFQGHYMMSGTELIADTGLSASTTAMIGFQIGSAGSETTVFDYECGGFECTTRTLSDEHSTIQFNNTLLEYDEVRGNFYGYTGILTDEFGDATAYVSTYATSVTGGNHPLLTFETVAYIDPYFYIDPEWLALNPGATLSLPEGVGNSITPVPLPGSLPFMLSGLGLLGALVRRRNHQIV
jgi:hypothetical protein